MTGPEHYAEAERLLAIEPDTGERVEHVLNRTARAQVHATLALAAATDRGLARMRPRADGLASG